MPPQDFIQLVNIDEDAQLLFLNGFKKVIVSGPTGGTGATVISGKDLRDNKVVVGRKKDKGFTIVTSKKS